VRVNSGTDPLRRFSALPSVVALGEYPPTEQAYAVYDKLSGLIGDQLKRFDAAKEGDIAAFNRELASRGVSLLG